MIRIVAPWLSGTQCLFVTSFMVAGSAVCHVLFALFLIFFFISGLAGREPEKAIDRLLHTLRIDAGSSRGQIGATRTHGLSGSRHSAGLHRGIGRQREAITISW